MSVKALISYLGQVLAGKMRTGSVILLPFGCLSRAWRIQEDLLKLFISEMLLMVPRPVMMMVARCWGKDNADEKSDKKSN